MLGAARDDEHYDLAGNRTTSPVSSSHGHAAPNRLISDDAFTYGYDHRGSLTTRTAADGSGTTTYQWSARGELTSVDGPGTSGDAAFGYDALGRRVRKQVGGSAVRYVYDGEDIALETDGATGALLRRYRHGPGIDQPLVVEEAGSGESFFLHAGHLGSVVLATDESGAVAAEYAYDAYGWASALTDGVEQPYAFTGREWDRETGLYYYRARYYDPASGRFLSQDPIGFAGGDANLYRYVQNNPLRWTDPWGLWRWPWTIYDEASLDARKLFPSNRSIHNGLGDAYRHCLASCMLARENSQRESAVLGWLNEKKGDILGNQPCGERRMDDENNRKGREIGKDAKSTEDCRRECRAASLTTIDTLTPGYWY